MLISVLSVSTAAIVIRQAQEEVSSLTIAAYRLGIAAVVMSIYAALFCRREIFKITRQQLILTVLSGFLLALHFGTWITSLEYTSVTSSVVLVSLSSLWVALLSLFVLKEKMGWSIWVGLALALAGSILVAASTSATDTQSFFKSRSMFGNVLAFSGAWFLAGYLIIGRRLRSSLDLSSYVFIIFLVASLTLFAGAIISGNRIIGFPAHNYLYFLFLGIVPQLFGHAAFNWALKYLSATFVSIALLGEPVGAAVLALILLKEPPTILEIMGGICILVGIFISSRSSQ